jgi:hypothetical protein
MSGGGPASATTDASPGRVPPPLIVVGAERSGTTLVATLLGKHGAYAALPETHLYRLVIPWLARDAEASTVVRAVVGSERWPDFGLSEDELEAGVRERIDAGLTPQAAAFRAVCELQARAAGKSQFVEKTPAHLVHIPRILEDVPDARFIVVVRDARDVCRSLVKAPWNTATLPALAARWRRAVLEGNGSLARFPGRGLLVRFEDVVLEPWATLERMCAHAGVQFEEGMLRPTESASTVPAWEREWKDRATGPIDPDRVFAWRRHADDTAVRHVGWVCRDALSTMGYPQGPELSPRERWRTVPVRLREYARHHPLVSMALMKRSARTKAQRLAALLWSWRGARRDPLPRVELERPAREPQATA